MGFRTLLDNNCVLLDGNCDCRKDHLYEDCKYSEKNKEPKLDPECSDKEWEKRL